MDEPSAIRPLDPNGVRTRANVQFARDPGTDHFDTLPCPRVLPLKRVARPSTSSRKLRQLAFQLALAAIPAGLTLGVERLAMLADNGAIAFAQKCAMTVVMPGLIFSGLATGNVHAFPLWLAAAANLVLYLILIRFVIRLVQHSRSGDKRGGN